METRCSGKIAKYQPDNIALYSTGYGLRWLPCSKNAMKATDYVN
jgi:hypothetical protein